VHRASDDGQIEIHTAVPLLPQPSPFDVEITVARLENYKPSVVMNSVRIDLSITVRDPLTH
jgi:hypothetical protein